MTLRVREAGSADIPGVAALLDALVSAGLRTRAAGIAAARDDYVAFPKRLRCSVAEDGDRIVGVQIISPAWPDNPYDASEGVGIIGTHVHPDAHGRGVGRALFSETLDVARASELTSIEAYIQTGNALGHAYYSAMGFREDRLHGTALIRVYTLH